MEKKVVSGIMLTLTLLSISTLAYNIKPVKAGWTWTETVYIRADGSIEPADAPIESIDNITYTLTDDIIGNIPFMSSAVVIQRDNTVFSGAGYIIQGAWASYSKGILLSGRNNVTIENVQVKRFYYGIYLSGSTNCRIENVTATDNGYGIALYWESNQNILSHNNATYNSYGIYIEQSNNNNITTNTVTDGSLRGICLWNSPNNVLFGNIISESRYGIELLPGSWGNILSGNVVSTSWVDGIVLNGAHNNALSGNIVSANGQYGISIMADNNIICGNDIVNNLGSYWSSGIYLQFHYNNIISGNTIKNNMRGISFYGESENNRIFHNNFIDNTNQVGVSGEHSNTWDDGYPSGGNYWSDYADTDLLSGPDQNELGSDGIWDHPYVIDFENRDRYPFAEPWAPTITATIDVDPNALNLRSRGQWITAYIELPEGHSATEIDISTIKLNCAVLVDPDAPTEIGDYDSDGVVDIMVKFKKTEVVSNIEEGLCVNGWRFANIEFTVKGELYDGTRFTGVYTVKVIKGDVNGDGAVDIIDLSMVAVAYGTFNGESRYNSQVDMNQDDVIDVRDLSLVAREYGTICP